MEIFKPIPTGKLQDDALLRAIRLNSLGSLFYFLYVALRRKKLSASLHYPLCLKFERDHIRDVIEIPRDHCKSTCAGEGLPMWRSLPVSKQDIDEFYAYGYSDEFVRWICKIHNPDLRNLLVSENITNAAKLGKKIRWHFESNGLYRSLFPETLPDSSCTWTDYSLHVKRPQSSTGGAHGEGTFDFMGVGSAIQSRHYNGLLVEDDLVGRKAIESQSIMDKTVEYHQLLVGAFESDDTLHENDELIIGNRWSYHDLNSYMRENETWFRFESHSALGGCCSVHPPDTPIYPEMFTFEKLMQRKARLGAFNFSCQFLNNPSAPENADFRKEWLQYFKLVFDVDNTWKIVHEVNNGIVRKDLARNRLELAMTVDPNHSGNQGHGRCRHSIMVTAQSDDAQFYLLESWAQASSYDAFYNKIFEIAKKWGLHRIGVETIAAQRYIAHHIQHLSVTKNWSVRIDELRGEVEAPDGTLSHKKEWRIRNVLAPIFEQQRFWCQRTQLDFMNEYETFPKGKYVDQLDALAYAPQLLHEPIDYKTHMHLLQLNRSGMERLGKPYSAGALVH
jgi:hypothetical protein